MPTMRIRHSTRSRLGPQRCVRSYHYSMNATVRRLTRPCPRRQSKSTKSWYTTIRTTRQTWSSAVIWSNPHCTTGVLTAACTAADTVVILGGTNPAILEKPSSKADQLDMLESYRGADVRVATGVTLGENLLVLGLADSCGPGAEISPPTAVQPQLATPGYSCTSLVVTSKVSAAKRVVPVPGPVTDPFPRDRLSLAKTLRICSTLTSSPAKASIGQSGAIHNLIRRGLRSSPTELEASRSRAWAAS